MSNTSLKQIAALRLKSVKEKAMSRFNAEKLVAALKAYRTHHGLGLRQHARYLGISPTTLYRIEAGKIPDMQTLDTILTVLGWKAGSFFGDTPDLPIATLTKDREELVKALEKILEEADSLDESIPALGLGRATLTRIKASEAEATDGEG